jgi:hypothetical protein
MIESGCQTHDEVLPLCADIRPFGALDFGIARNSVAWRARPPVGTENLIRVDDVMESPRLAE